MKNLCKWCLLLFALIIGVTSCEDVENFEQCPEITVNIDNVPGSVVYRFVAQIDGIEDVRLTWSVDGDEVDSGNLEDIAGQILDYKFEPGKHTVCVKVASEDCPIEVCKEFEVIRDDNNPCPDLFFEARQHERPSKYKFIADFEGIERATYGWYINDELVEDSNPNEDNYFYWEFDETGRYEVCIKTETPECPEGTSYCKVIEVKEVDGTCPKVYFEKEMEPGTVGTYNFEAVLKGNTEGAEIKWFINDERIEHPTDPQEGARVLTYQFDPGAYKVCLKVFTPDCPDGAIFCKEIRVGEDSCPKPSFSRDGEYLYADFEGRDDLKWYGWYVNGELVDDEYLNRNRDNKFFLENLEIGTYEICILYETTNCPDPSDNKFCKEIVIERQEDCPKLSFEAEQDGDNPAYYFYPEMFDGMEDVKLEWYANGDYIGASPDSPLKNPFYYQFNPGRYEICLRVETPECPNGAEFCKVIEIEKPDGCLNLRFSRDGDYLYADFEGRDTLKWYGWVVDGTPKEDENLNNGRDNKFSLKDLEKGTYTICIVTETPECPNGTEFCQKITIE